MIRSVILLRPSSCYPHCSGHVPADLHHSPLGLLRRPSTRGRSGLLLRQYRQHRPGCPKDQRHSIIPLRGRHNLRRLLDIMLLHPNVWVCSFWRQQGCFLRCVRVSPGVCSCVAHCEPESIHWSDSHTIHIHNSLFAGNIYSAGTSNVSSSTSISTTQINAWLLNVISKFGYTGTSVPSTMSTGSIKSCTNSSGDTLLCNANSGEISEMFCVNFDREHPPLHGQCQMHADEVTTDRFDCNSVAYLLACCHCIVCFCCVGIVLPCVLYVYF